MSERENISASDINKYMYCSYQWYYTKVYDQAYLRELYKERNEQIYGVGGTDAGKSAFTRGSRFHDNYLRAYKRRRAVKILFAAVCVIFIVVVILLRK